MFVKLTVKSIAGYKLNGTTQTIVFNARNIYDWQTYNTTDSRFRYVLNPHDRREAALLVTVDDTIASKLAAANTAFGDTMIKLPVETTVGGDTTDMYIPVESITWAEAAHGEADHSYIKFCEGGRKVREVMVPFSLTDILYVGSTGTSSS